MSDQIEILVIFIVFLKEKFSTQKLLKCVSKRQIDLKSFNVNTRILRKISVKTV